MGKETRRGKPELVWKLRMILKQERLLLALILHWKLILFLILKKRLLSLPFLSRPSFLLCAPKLARRREGGRQSAKADGPAFFEPRFAAGVLLEAVLREILLKLRVLLCCLQFPLHARAPALQGPLLRLQVFLPQLRPELFLQRRRVILLLPAFRVRLALIPPRAEERAEFRVRFGPA